MTSRIEVHATPWQEVVLACRKCGKKLGNEGFGPDGDQALPRALRSVLRRDGRRQEVRVVETRCLGLCPKRAVAVLLASRPGTLLAVGAGTPAEIVMTRLTGLGGR